MSPWRIRFSQAECFKLREKLQPRTTQGLCGAETDDNREVPMDGINKVCVYCIGQLPCLIQ